MASVRARALAVAIASLSLFLSHADAANRPLPEDVSVKAIAKQNGERLELLVRVPLAAVKDIEFPIRGENGELDLTALKSMLPGAAKYWIADCFEVREDGALAAKPQVVATRVALNSDTSLDSYEEAMAHMNGADLPPQTDVSAEQVWLDIDFEYALHSAHAVLAVRPKVAALGVRVTTDLAYVRADGGVRDYSFDGDPGLIFLDARWMDAAKQFVQQGFRLVLVSGDFLVLLFCLALPLRSFRELAPSAIAFAAAACLTLAAGAFGLAPDGVWQRPLIETLSAISILAIAFANILGNVLARRRALMAVTIGCVYGFIGLFDFDAKVQFGGAHAVVSLVAYGAGMALAVGMLAAVMVPVLSMLSRSPKTERVETIVFSALAADTVWGWLEERWAELRKIPVHIPVFDGHLLAVTLRYLAVLVLFGGLLWFVDGWLKSHPFSAAELAPKDKGGAAR